MIKPFVVIIPSAGTGSRFLSDKPKQYSLIQGQTVLELSLEPFLDFSECVGICVTVSPEDQYWKSLDLTRNPKIEFIEGGSIRSLSVKKGFEFWKSSSLEYESVLIHDSVRPCVRSSDIREMLEDFSQNSFDGSVLGSPVTDSIKRLSPQTQTINNTINRETLWRAFTPQIFCKQILEKAYKNSKEGTEFSDESSMVEKLSSNIKAYNGSGDNIKITHPEDINLAKSILVSQGRVDK